MKKVVKVFYFIGLFLTLVIGVGHFFVPTMFWYPLIDGELPDKVKISIDWVNYFFSLFLIGKSIILLIHTDQFFNANKEVILFYLFLVFIWFNRIVITIVHTWAYDALFYMQLGLFIPLFLIMAFPVLYLFRMKKIRQKEEERSGV